MAIEAFDSALAVHLRGVFLAMKYEIAAMRSCGGGSIVNMSSMAGLTAIGGLAGYVAGKFGVVGLTQSAALDYAAYGIRINAVAPGPILTERLRQAGERSRRSAARAVPLGELGTPEQVAAAVVWLCSNESSFTTGTVLRVDGGILSGRSPFRPAVGT